MSRLFGEIQQNGYVVRDIEAAMRHWTEVLGVGPFYYLKQISIAEFRYRDEPSDPVLSVALAQSGPLQIELIQQHGEAPTMYRDFLEAGNEGLQHLGYLSADLEKDLRSLSPDFSIAQSGSFAGGAGGFVYLDTQAHPGTVVELIQLDPGTKALFDRVALDAEGWDGSAPIRPLEIPSS